MPPSASAPAGSGTAVVRGRVVRSNTGAAIPRARVQITGGGAEPRTVLTADDGTYQITGLPAGQYRILGSKTGFVSLSYEQTQPNEPFQPLALADGETREDIEIRLPPAGAIEGFVYDEYGDPAGAAAVQVLRARFVNGERRLVPEGGGGTITDDLGRFRVWGLAPGEYYLSASTAALNTPPPLVVRAVAPGLVGGTSPTYYPGTVFPEQAQTLRLDMGQQISGIFIQTVPVRTATIAGTARSGTSAPVSTMRVMLRQSTPGGGTSSRGTAVRPDGSFSFPDLPPGEYTIAAQVADTEAAFVPVVLSGEDVTVSLVTAPIPRIRGRVSFDTGAPPADVSPSAVRLRMMPASGVSSSPAGVVSDDWTFDILGMVGPGRVTANLASPGWYLKGVYHNGLDVTDRDIEVGGRSLDGVEVVLTQRVTRLSGSVSAERGASAAGAYIVVFAADAQRWTPRSRFVRVARPNTDNWFSVQGLPPADYLIAAVVDFEPGEETSVERLEALRARSKRVSLAEGESRTIELRLEAP